MSPRGQVEIGIKVTADTSGVAKTVDAFSQVRQQTLDMARANGANEESVRRLGVAYDRLAATWDTLQEMSAQGMITDEEGMAAWAEAEAIVTKEIREMGLAAKRTGDEVEKSGEQTRKASTIVDFFANANGRSAGTLRVSNERTVLLGQAMAGLVAQYTMGADAQSLFMSGATNIAMMMSTAGPWGMAAGFAAQALAVLAAKYFEVRKAEEAAAEKQISAMEARVKAARDAARDEESYAKAVERTALAIDMKVAAMQREQQFEESRKQAAAAQVAREDELQKLRNEEAVKKGEMSPEAALEDDVIRRDKALFDQQIKEIEAIEQQRADALQKRADAEAQFAANKAALEKAQADAAAAQAAETAAANERNARETITRNEAEIEDIRSQRAATASVIGPEYDKIRARLDNREAQLTSQNAAAQAAIPQAMQEETEARRGRPNLGTAAEERARAEKAAEAYDASLPALYKQQQDAASVVDDAEMKRLEVTNKQRDEREKFRLGLSEPEREILDRLNPVAPDDMTSGTPPPLKAAPQSGVLAAKQGADQGLSESLGKLADAAEKGNEGDQQVAARIAQAAKALGDGGTKDELVKVGAALIEAGQLNDQAAKGMLAAAKKALQDAKQALREVQDLRAQISTL